MLHAHGLGMRLWSQHHSLPSPQPASAPGAAGRGQRMESGLAVLAQFKKYKHFNFFYFYFPFLTLFLNPSIASLLSC